MTGPERSVKTTSRVNLYARVLNSSVEMVPCSACEKRDKKCVASEGNSKRCALCVRLGLPRCDMGGPVPSDWKSLDASKERVEREWDEAERKQNALFEKHQKEQLELQARFKRLQSQRNFLRRREAEMLRRGLASLDELDAAEEEERLAAERAQPGGEASVSTDPAASLDPPMDPDLAEALATYDPSNPFWIDAGFSGVADAGWADFDGGTSSTTQGS